MLWFVRLVSGDRNIKDDFSFLFVSLWTNIHYEVRKPPRPSRSTVHRGGHDPVQGVRGHEKGVRESIVISVHGTGPTLPGTENHTRVVSVT